MSTPPSAARVVLGSRLAATMLGAMGALGAVGVVGIVACSGSVVSLSGDQPVLDGGFTAVDPETISESTRRCSVGTDHPFVCCRFEDDGGATLTCGAWNLTPFYPCPAGYAEYVNPSPAARRAAPAPRAPTTPRRMRPR